MPTYTEVRIPIFQFIFERQHDSHQIETESQRNFHLLACHYLFLNRHLQRYIENKVTNFRKLRQRRTTFAAVVVLFDFMPAHRQCLNSQVSANTDRIVCTFCPISSGKQQVRINHTWYDNNSTPRF